MSTRRLVWVLLGLALACRPLLAQTLPIKRLPPAPEPGTCPAMQVGGATQAASTALLDSLLSAGSRAAILGDHAAAEQLLRRAAALDPHNSVVSYRLARTLDDQGQEGAAAVEYCRYLALAPDAPDGYEIRRRARALLSSAREASPEPWRAETEAGLQAFDGGRYEEAAAAFSRALDLSPDFADAHYNRAVARLNAGRAEEAVADLDAYLRLTPAAEDALRVRDQLDRLRAPAPNTVERPTPLLRRAAPGSVLAQGLVVPGLGQHATGRTVLGMAVLAAVGGAVYFGLRQEVVVRRAEAHDPFGNRYEYDLRTLERPNLALGIGAAAGIGLVAALESFLYAKRQPRPQVADATSGVAGSLRSMSLSVGPSDGAVRIGVSIAAGSKRSLRHPR